MAYAKGHLTAGDLAPITMQVENTYNVPSGAEILCGDVRDGGKFAFTDTPNPYLNWRYGSRSFDPDDYVTQQEDAGFQDSIEVRDISGWHKILEFALGENGTADYGALPSRTVAEAVRTGASVWQGRTYHGCKTDSLTVRADAPGAVVQFDESVLASYGEDDNFATPKAVWSSSTAPAVQWLGGITLNGTALYPQSFTLTVSNNLDRKRAPNNPNGGGTYTYALLEGRREIEAEFDLWMEDLAFVRSAIGNGEPGDIVLTLGLTNPKTVTLSGVRWMADGTHPDLIQDKQRQTLRFRVSAVSIEDPEAEEE